MRIDWRRVPRSIQMGYSQLSPPIASPTSLQLSESINLAAPIYISLRSNRLAKYWSVREMLNMLCAPISGRVAFKQIHGMADNINTTPITPEILPREMPEITAPTSGAD